MKFILLSTTVTFLLVTLVSASPIAQVLEMDHSPAPGSDNPEITFTIGTPNTLYDVKIPLNDNRAFTHIDTMGSDPSININTLRITDAWIRFVTGGVFNNDVLCQLYKDARGKEPVGDPITGHIKTIYKDQTKFGSYRCRRKGEEKKGQEKKGEEKKGEEKKGEEKKGEEKKGQEKKGQEKKVQEKKGQEKKGQEKKGQEKKGQEKKGQEKKGQDFFSKALAKADSQPLYCTGNPLWC
jgi:hypothetical protein